jgi:hypothetical protein
MNQNFIIGQRCKYPKKDGTGLCTRKAYEEQNFCKFHLNTLRKERGLPKIPQRVKKRKPRPLVNPYQNLLSRGYQNVLNRYSLYEPQVFTTPAPIREKKENSDYLMDDFMIILLYNKICNSDSKIENVKEINYFISYVNLKYDKNFTNININDDYEKIKSLFIDICRQVGSRIKKDTSNYMTYIKSENEYNKRQSMMDE